jgi:hypothetical protein
MSEIPSTVIKKDDQLGSNVKNTEDWIVIPSKNQLFVHAQRDREVDERISTSARNGWCLQSTAVQVLARLSDTNDMGFVCIFVPSDVDLANVEDFLRQLTKVAKRKSFSVTSMTLPNSLEDCLSIFGVEANTSNKFSTAQFKPLSVH